jgi:hypothetical protein
VAGDAPRSVAQEIAIAFHPVHDDVKFALFHVFWAPESLDAFHMETEIP